MEDGELRISFEKGRVLSVETASGLATRYEGLFRNALKDLASDSGRVNPAIRVITFGPFWLEAVLSSHLGAILDVVSSTPTHASAFWQATRRLPLVDKCSLMINPTNGTSADELAESLRGVAQLSDLRNRLAHFKPDHTEVPLPSDFVPDLDGLRTLFLDIPDSDLVAFLKSAKVERLGAVVESAKGLFDRVLAKHLRVREEAFGRENPGT